MALPALAQGEGGDDVVVDVPAGIVEGPVVEAAPVVEEAPVDSAAAQPSPPDAVPVEPAEAPPPSPSTVSPVAVDLFSPCVLLARRGVSRSEVDACLQHAVTSDPESLSAVRARAAKTMLDAVGVAEAPAFAAPGRLELVGVGGVFGVWNAIAVGTTVGISTNADPGPMLIGTAVLALAAGVGFGYGGHLLGEEAALDEGGGKLVASGLVWGTNMGIAAAFFALDAIRPETSGLQAMSLFGPIVTMGYVGGAVGFAAAKLGRFDAAQVSLVNSGGALGSFLGGMVAINMLQQGVQGTAPYAFTYMAGNAVGLVGFGVLGNTLKLTWSETLIGDLGMVIGGTVGGLGMVGALLSMGGNNNGAAVTLTTGAASVGAVGGYAAGLLVATMLRTGDDISAAPKVALTPSSGAVVDGTGALVPTMGMQVAF